LLIFLGKRSQKKANKKKGYQGSHSWLSNSWLKYIFSVKLTQCNV
jgi:hypothetical protein